MIEKIIEENNKQREELLIKKSLVRKNNIETLAFIIEELYYLKIVEDIELKILVQEENFGSLFTCPHFLFKSSKMPNVYLKKDINWAIEIVKEENKNIKPNMFNDHEIFTKYEEIGWSNKVLGLINTMSHILDEYEWDHFTNIGSLERSNLWVSYQDKEDDNKKEQVWIGSLSEKKYVETLAIIADHYNFESLKDLMIKKQKERLEKNLLDNNPTNKLKVKI